MGVRWESDVSPIRVRHESDNYPTTTYPQHIPQTCFSVFKITYFLKIKYICHRSIKPPLFNSVYAQTPFRHICFAYCFTTFGVAYALGVCLSLYRHPLQWFFSSAKSGAIWQALYDL